MLLCTILSDAKKNVYGVSDVANVWGKLFVGKGLERSFRDTT